jgi:phage tail sheath protein FI
LLIRRGNDTTNQKVALETWTNLSLDPNSENYISRVIGDTYNTINTSETVPYVEINGTYPNKSRYVYVSQVTNTTNYFDNNGNAKSGLTGSLPAVGSGSFGGAVGEIIHGSDTYYENITGASNIQGVRSADYTQSISLLSNQDEYQFHTITAPGLIIDNTSTEITQLINMVQERGDAIAVVDPSDYGATLATMTAAASTYNSSYAATYAPWLQTTDPDTGNLVWVPASTMIPGVYAYNDRVGEAWFAPAGLNRGGLATVVRPERKLSQANRDTLYTSKVNPIASFPGAGTVVFGQKTLQQKASALDRVNVRRLLIELKSYISSVSDNLVFEQNTIATRNAFLSQVNPYLESVQQRQGLYAFKVIMDDSNNTPDVIDRNQLVGQIYLQPTKTAEYILLDFNVLPTGATFPA